MREVAKELRRDHFWSVSRPWVGWTKQKNIGNPSGMALILCLHYFVAAAADFCFDFDTDFEPVTKYRNCYCCSDPSKGPGLHHPQSMDDGGDKDDGAFFYYLLFQSVHPPPNRWADCDNGTIMMKFQQLRRTGA